jgi:hypothetical protein
LVKPLTLAVMSLGFGVVQLDVTIVNTTWSSIGASLGGGVSGLQWVVSIYTIAFAGLILTAGAGGCQRRAHRGASRWGGIDRTRPMAQHLSGQPADRLGRLVVDWALRCRQPGASRELDLLGQTAAIGSLGILAAAFIESGRLGWGDPWVIAAFGAAVILTVLFLIQESRAKEPMLPLSP